ncbi:MBL fold metallo-hydrolase [Spirillospora sp. CA-294931]|uniref:MBL fold metallo-hydrolase n=1 Tax=Spirillospora sp. CA-294931 TaxID=3240042 RepID=UPI003D8B8817
MRGWPGAVAVAAGETFSAGGFSVKAVGGEQAEVIDGLPGCPNLGFLVDGLYHPGDSFFVPSEEVETLLVPASGPWVKIGEAITFVRGVRPARAFPIHDIQLSRIGLEYFDEWLEEEAEYARIPAGASVDL